jgi:hypothetical protein
MDDDAGPGIVSKLLVVICIIGALLGGAAGKWGKLGKTAKVACDLGSLVDSSRSCPANTSTSRATPPPTPPATPRASAAFTNVSWVNRAPYLVYRLDMTFAGLKGRKCRIDWQAVFLDTGALGGTHGSVWTGVLPSDQTGWWIDNLWIPEPSGTRRWGTIFQIYCPDLLATRRPAGV